jgi:hypothetical protein
MAEMLFPEISVPAKTSAWRRRSDLSSVHIEITSSMQLRLAKSIADAAL